MMNKEKFICFIQQDKVKEMIQIIQEIIFWRRPILIFITFLIVEFIFITIYQLHFDIASTLLFLLIVFNIIRLLCYCFGPFFKSYFLKPLPQDEPNSPNRIRTMDEVQNFLEDIFEKIEFCISKFKNYTLSPTISEHILFFSSSFLIFLITMTLGSYRLMFLVIHSILVLPGLICSPKVRQLFNTCVEKITNIKGSEKLKNE